MTDKQPEALRLADAVADFSRYATESGEAAKYRRFVAAKEAAAELCRLHEVNAELVRLNSELVEALWKLTELYDAMGAPKGPCRIIAEAVLAKAEGK